MANSGKIIRSLADLAKLYSDCGAVIQNEKAAVEYAENAAKGKLYQTIEQTGSRNSPANSNSNKNNKSNKSTKSATFHGTTTYCRYSGLAIQQSDYFQGADSIRCASHFIFSQNPETVLKYAAKAKTYEQKLLTQLAILKTLNCLNFAAPISPIKRVVELNHTKIVNAYICWLNARPEQKEILVGGTMLPILKIGAKDLRAPNASNLESFYDSWVQAIENMLLVDTTEKAADILDSELNFVNSANRKELQKYAEVSPPRYTKKLGRETLEYLAENPLNVDLIENLEYCKNFLLNDGYKTSDNLAYIYSIFQNAHLPEESFQLSANIKLILTYLATNINLLLDLEAGFYGKKEFNIKSGKIINCAEIELDLSDEDFVDIIEENKKKTSATPAKPKTVGGLGLSLKGKSKLKTVKVFNMNKF